MVAVTRILDLRESIENFLLQRRAELKLPSPLKREYSIRVLNQEKDGCLLYTWDEITAWSQSVTVAHFGQYDPVTQSHQVLYIYNQCVHVVSASINQQRTLLAFTTYDKNGEVGRTVDVSKRSSKGIYRVFLAEIKAKNTRVFSLNLERPVFLKAQFLYVDSDSDKESRMIVFLHRESVGLYSIPLGRVGEKGMVMRGQPKTEQIVKKFVWCQWDAVNQRLFYIYFRSHGDEDKEPILACLQFYSNARHDNMDFQALFLDAAVLAIASMDRWDIPALDDEVDLMSTNRHAPVGSSYCGSLVGWDLDRDLLIPLCCAWQIHDQYPNAFGQ